MSKKTDKTTKENREAAAKEAGADTETGEVKAVPAIVRNEDGTITLPGGKRVKVKKVLTRLLLKHADNTTVAVRILDKIHESKAIKGSTMKPADMVTVVDLTDNHEKDYIVNAVLKGILEDTYKNDYVGKELLIHRGEKAPKKRYVTFEVAELA